MKNQLIVSLSPHDKGHFSVKKIMWGVVAALVPAIISSVYYFGISALKVTLLGVFFCVGIEYIISVFFMKNKNTISDGSAVITGILLAFNLPSSIPWWQILIGSAVAVGISKMAFGGLGKNPFNPALVGRAFLLASYPVSMTSWPKPLVSLGSFMGDAVTGATPLAIVKEAAKSETAIDAVQKIPSLFDMFIGNTGGCIGEVSAAAILLGGVYMLFKKIITWHIPVMYLLSLAGFTAIFWLINPDKYFNPLFHILAGGAMLGAWFMATDMVTSPMTVKGQIIFAVGGGILCGLIRLFGSYPEGCSYSILLMNAFVPLIDKYCKPKRFGKEVNYGS